MNNSTEFEHEMELKSEVWDSDSNDGAGKTKAKRKPRGGKKCLYMDPKEVKACRELGFDLENDDDGDYNHNQEKQEHHEEKDNNYSNFPPTKIITKRSSLSRQYSSTSSTSTGDNTPIQNWCISSPGDDPRDVKARLKVWAQAVALESTSQRCNTN